ncbi:glycosyltransferase_family 2 protein [Hexamita inflata]|uniref:Glycosyltransferase family 2 protein n=1 Tax=Hexamita inflata TaxID=28002 RepID=A0AA86TSX8_9EUKA|nr:glycosyltransferase family 2 protein [Hexamita inflata]
MSHCHQFLLLILPCYIQAANLRKSILFLLNQSFKNFEIVCVNDGSTEDTKTVIQHFQQLDTYITLTCSLTTASPSISCFKISQIISLYRSRTFSTLR